MMSDIERVIRERTRPQPDRELGPVAQEIVDRRTRPQVSHEDTVHELSKYPHETHKLLEISGDSEDGWVSPTEPAPLDGADIIISEIKGLPGFHTVMLDIDVPAHLVPSTTPGHSHLYIDVPIEWVHVLDILEALSNAGIVQEGYFRASKERGWTALRLPWVQKEKA